MKSLPLIACYLAALALSALGAIVDLRNADVQVPVLIVGASAFLLALLRPRHAWPFALILGAGIPLGHLYARRIGMRLPYTMNGAAGPLLALLPAFVGSSVAVALRKAITIHHQDT